MSQSQNTSAQTASPSTKLPGSPVTRALWIIGSTLAVALLILSFFGGMFVGQARAERKLERLSFAKRQLTEDLDKPIKDRPLLKQLPGPIKKELKEHGARGKVIEVNSDALVVDTPDGARSVSLTAETKIMFGKDKSAGSVEDLKPGTQVMVLGAKPSQDGDTLNAAAIIINPPEQKPAQKPQN